MREISLPGEDGLGREAEIKEFRKIDDMIAHDYCKKSKDEKLLCHRFII